MTKALALAAALGIALAPAAPARGEEPARGAALGPATSPPASATPPPPPAPAAPPAPAGAAERFSFVVELGAYYTSAGIYVPLGERPVPHVGERGELDLYLSLLPRSLLPGFVVLEASVNPLPCLGLAVKDRAGGVYRRAQVDPDLNLVRAATAGFEEPWAASLFLGNVANYDVPGRKEIQGKGYLGALVSVGNWHIKDNVAVDDRWLEVEAKLMGYRRSPAKKLAWSFRGGVKLHGHPGVVDVAYVGLRRSRVDFASGAPSLVANSGMEYRFDVSLDGRPLRHHFLVDKKWPTAGRVAVTLGVGFLWEAGRAYRGALAGDARERFQLLIRPNVEF